MRILSVFNTDKLFNKLPVFFVLLWIFQFGKGDEILTFTSPQATIYFLNSDTKVEISLGADVRNYSIGLALTEIECSIDPETHNPGLIISSGLNEQSIEWQCLQINEEHNWRPIGNKFQALRAWPEVDSKSILIQRSGDWTKSKAKAILIASIYLDTYSDCSAEEFNCNQECNLEKTETFKQLSRKTTSNKNRCIPATLKCDGRPSCGMICNADEIDKNCKDDYSYPDIGSGLSTGLIIAIVVGPIAIILSIGLVVFLFLAKLRRRNRNLNGMVIQRNVVQNIVNPSRPSGTITFVAVPKLVGILSDDYEVVQNRERFCLALGITPAQLIDIQRSVAIYVSTTDGFLTLALKLWIRDCPDDARIEKLIQILIDEGFALAAEKMIRLAESEFWVRRIVSQTTETQIAN